MFDLKRSRPIRQALLSAALILTAGGASAADPPAATTSPKTPPPSDPTTVGSVVVDAAKPPSKRCGERDKPCLVATARYLWAQFPGETQKWCSAQEAKVMAKSFQMTALADAFGDEGPSAVGVSHSLPAPVKIVCDYPKEAAKAVAKPGR